MSKIVMLNLAAEKVKEIKFNDNFWGIKPNDPVLHNSLVFVKSAIKNTDKVNEALELVSFEVEEVVEENTSEEASQVQE